MMKRLALVLACLFLFTGLAFAQKTVHVKGYVKKDGTVVQPYDRKAPSKKTETTSTTASEIVRDGDGQIVRSGTQKHAFMVQTGYPKGRPGYVVDHIIPLACGGPDVKENMQWQTIADGKAKDKVELKGCRR